MQGRSRWCGWITTVRKITGWHFATSMTPAPTRQQPYSFPALSPIGLSETRIFSSPTTTHSPRPGPTSSVSPTRGKTRTNRSEFLRNPSRWRKRCRESTSRQSIHREFRSDSLQFRHVNNLLFQETQTKLSGRHTFRYGVEFLRQLATQRPAARYLGELNYTNAPGLGYSAFANFLDDFSGPELLRRGKTLAPTLFHPDQFRQTYFFQDTWLPAPSLSLTLGLRYENFGQLANALRFPAFAGFDPDDFLKPNRVNTDNNNFGPAFGLAWSPSFRSGWLHKLFGENKTVWRGGFQISYDAFFTQMLSLFWRLRHRMASASDFRGLSTGRGTPNWFEQLPAVASAPSLLDAQLGALEKDFRSPYTERWSFGFQRQLSNKLVLDGSYVGSQSHKLTTWDEVNPLVNRLTQRATSSSGLRWPKYSHQPGKFLLPRHAVARGSPLCARISSDGVLYLVAEHRQHQRGSRRRRHPIFCR